RRAFGDLRRRGRDPHHQPLGPRPGPVRPRRGGGRSLGRAAAARPLRHAGRAGPEGMSDLLARAATAQLLALKAKEVSAVELLKLSLARHGQTHSRLNAVVAADLERALDTAKAMDDLRVKGATLGPLCGLPMTIKDTLD